MLTNQIQVFDSPQFGAIRTITREGSPLFCLVDVCKALDLGNPSQVKTRLEYGVISNEVIYDSLGRQQEANFVTEDGLYDCIFDSRKPEAKAFRKWVTSEVLPSIRKNGGYIMTDKEDSPEEIMAKALNIANAIIEKKNNLIKEQEKRIASLEPAECFAKAVTTSEHSILIGELAKILRQNGIEMGQNRLFRWMRENGYLCSKGESYNHPSQKSLELGLMEIKKSIVLKPNGDSITTTTTKVTGKGQVYFVNRFL